MGLPNRRINMAVYINLTPHVINLNDGRYFEPSGEIARVESTFTEYPDTDIQEMSYGEVIGLPEESHDGVFYIVSGVVATALNGVRSDVVTPATGSKDCIRNDKGFIKSVPFFYTYQP